jgi:hypothetical protein
MSQFHQNFITTVIDLYGLELDDHQVDPIVATWLQKYDSAWIVKAIVESLYRGRYKIVSVDNILRDWQRLGKPRYNFTPEYEREILQNLPDLIDLPVMPAPPNPPSPVDRSESQYLAVQPLGLSSKNLNPEESAPFQRHNQSISTDRLTTATTETVVVSQTQVSADLESSDNLSLENRPRFIFLPPSSNSRDHRSKIGVNRIVASPANHQLFKTLKAIVDPYNQQSAGVQLVFPPLATEQTNSPEITQFQLPVEQVSE